ncbi:Protein rds1 [Tolypocladium ophioglossoides CBS 100239]|uniref:Protein rds1 n=1 Tax=Tolypocladium ophioglossoides (strain CBS 100239) TaxID=1163406 RepID=A0A0L0NM48_TOLOC|nr:Protein rds1 [Tolypocladium ophioglossoides CBS 100239]
MHRSLALLAGCLVPLSVATPLEKRNDFAAPPGGDVDILNYALTLEYLERKFYQEGLQNYTENDFTAAGFTQDFYTNLQKVYSDEMTHVTFLSADLGAKAVAEPTFAFPVKDARSFVSLASVLEGVGVSAYLGAASSIANKDYLTAAASILAVEARHASYLRAALGEKPFPGPFDTPLDFDQVYSMAAQFITGVAPGTKLPFIAFPPLTAAPANGGFCAGQTTLTFTGAQAQALKSGKVTQDTKVYAVFYSGLQAFYVPVREFRRVGIRTQVPANRSIVDCEDPRRQLCHGGQPAPAGQTYVTLNTADGKSAKASDENTIAGVALLEVSC